MSDPGENAQATPSDEESSDSYYKSKFKFKKNSIEIKKKSLLKDKIKKVDIERIIRSDPILSKINRPPETEGEVFCLATGSENSKGQPSSPPDTAAQNAKKPKNSSVVYFKEPTLTHKEINLHDGKDAKTDKREHPNGTDESAPLKNKCLPTSGGMKKSFLSSGKNKNKKKITSGILNDAYSLDGVKSPPGNAPRGHIGKPATKDDETKKKELSPLAIIKKHGRLANQIDEIHTSNGEEIEHLRSEYASIKNDLHKIMSIMNVGQRAVSSLK
ncbi:conserved Plasmodium protein, unknown function [Plasmodium vivax]|uniref:Uncharacterized protein n=6 Tax=Plasmodium vivax TaxID=5855 RepID=A5K5A0_PLAVS|nr:hypothetical protein, conserved [Plasmodium vivax]KMZ82324.1 hypothetical protein PVIIG_04438 [Plasmodium vivax India VII]KMZ86581.1 hypothetical protein PVBG_04740 [Plasmodium vivax Brazil I]KMZ92995.1 hypothetical protein PVMG_04707 [Plasmodium vivax Mauritania I]KMZ99441.1 hypothetical protein PVNG_04237 [Plasmodium vivax North Korean]EDL45828.1 hypothetical protein, conserved [Plasmodium vivax]|eukprot:XP_001615555.1 hypothetical protein [Plasmodium vivax Sal-1]